MSDRLKALAFGGVLCGLLFTSAHPRASAERTMHLTFSGAVALPGVQLAAGTYTFELATPMGDQSLVRVSSRDGRKTYLLAFTTLVARPSNLRPGQVVSLGESARGVPPPIKAWYPDDTSIGHEFIYR